MLSDNLHSLSNINWDSWSALWTFLFTLQIIFSRVYCLAQYIIFISTLWPLFESRISTSILLLLCLVSSFLLFGLQKFDLHFRILALSKLCFLTISQASIPQKCQAENLRSWKGFLCLSLPLKRQRHGICSCLYYNQLRKLITLRNSEAMAPSNELPNFWCASIMAAAWPVSSST